MLECRHADNVFAGVCPKPGEAAPGEERPAEETRTHSDHDVNLSDVARRPGERALRARPGAAPDGACEGVRARAGRAADERAGAVGRRDRAPLPLLCAGAAADARGW